MAESDTIFALATPPGRSALAVFRLSGRASREVLRALTGKDCPRPREASLRTLRDPQSRDIIDQALVTFFAAPHSFTGEDMAEVSVHGGRSVVAALGRSLADINGVRQAEPGEFTRRAYLRGKFDLSQAEAIADLIDSETEFQRRQALRVLSGGLERKVASWRLRLLDITAELESSLDFSDEGDVGGLDKHALVSSSRDLQTEMARELEAGSRSLALRAGFTVVIAGPPNVGKSTLFNHLIGDERAIVTEFAGTTRDLLTARLDLRGVPVTLIDSAGLHEAHDPVERIGMQRAREAASSADLVVWLACRDTKDVQPEVFAAPTMVVWSKSDLQSPPAGGPCVSAFDSDSISKLAESIRAAAIAVVGDGTDGELIRERHRVALREAISSLKRCDGHIATESYELAAEECRSANWQFGLISGSFATEDVLGAIFQRFCIGK